MDLGLHNKIALVAAASSGLGRAVAEELATEGASLVICGRGTKAITETAAALTDKTGAHVLAVAGDVSVPNDVQRLVESGITRFGRIDILVTNAGGPPAGTFANITQEEWEAATRLTLYSVINLARQVLPGMKERRWGRILNITSIAVKQPVEGLLLSNSLRAAVTGFARTLANEVASDGITVNNILPGYTRTDRVEELARMMAEKQGITAKEFKAKWESEIPMKRLGEPHEFAALAAFLVSERASYITGTSMQVDGGWIRSLF
ncbi:MAG TPA: SDR family oxidoreductase [Pyrinomonadaceae bacterium]|jgi:Dehydrogenases with different specificities (related to short-chain alcohol dehydrogenases)|nr:SDR family oxidoreductase [Pyrinomonadaceae bacterium]